MKAPAAARRLLIVPLALCAVLAGGAAAQVQDQCGPFTDVSATLCPYVLEMYYLGITAGTSPTTYSPDSPLTRGQAAVFVSKGVNQAIARSSRRAALGQWWTTTPRYDVGLGVTTVGSDPEGLSADGEDVWVANTGSRTVSRVRASDGRLLGDWTGVGDPVAVLVAMGRVFVTSVRPPNGTLYMIDPTQPPGPATAVATTLPEGPVSITFDGARIWTANLDGSISIVTPSTATPWPVTSVSAGFVAPVGLAFDGTNVWVTDGGANTVFRLNPDGAIAQAVPVGAGPTFPVFDGSNLWVPNNLEGSISVVRARDGTVLTTLTGNGLEAPLSAAFDGERILVVSKATTRPGSGTVSLFRAADLSALGHFTADGFAACSDGIHFWITLQGAGQLARF